MLIVQRALPWSYDFKLLQGASKTALGSRDLGNDYDLTLLPAFLLIYYFYASNCIF